ncbi:glycosyltransferase [Robiginitalea myxolifaciens]|uniref:Glycosyltransferase n=1 Tax=Robiginitalea myxolifaciens TaxID=400055 RepID=A0A1I6FN93_9FLAO|nr:glycosyltransferase family 2 protein [Robiginitalea myxolifaciens]SFR31334.1 glycosyltransferase [Robiginitalea myxolifaciens]
MTLTLITATYDSAETLEACLNSVAMQDYKQVEHLIIDGGSSDGSKQIVYGYQSKIPGLKWFSEPDQGIYDALNKGINKARGDVIGFLHSDDLLPHSRVLSSIAKSIDQNNTDGLYGDLKYVSKEDPTRVIRYWKSQPFNPKLLRRGWMPAHPTFFLKRDVYRKHGKFNLKYKISADYDFMLRVLRDPELSFNYLPKVLVHMRTGGASNKSLSNLIQKSKEDYQVMRDHNFRIPLWSLTLKNISKIGQFLNK